MDEAIIIYGVSLFPAELYKIPEFRGLSIEQIATFLDDYGFVVEIGDTEDGETFMVIGIVLMTGQPDEMLDQFRKMLENDMITEREELKHELIKFGFPEEMVNDMVERKEFDVFCVW